jgi:hypothetical protein
MIPRSHDGTRIYAAANLRPAPWIERGRFQHILVGMCGRVAMFRPARCRIFSEACAYTAFKVYKILREPQRVGDVLRVDKIIMLRSERRSETFSPPLSIVIGADTFRWKSSAPGPNRLLKEDSCLFVRIYSR